MSYCDTKVKTMKNKSFHKKMSSNSNETGQRDGLFNEPENYFDIKYNT